MDEKQKPTSHGKRHLARLWARRVKTTEGAGVIESKRRIAVLVMTAALALVVAPAAAASGPKLTVSKSDLEAAFHCPLGAPDARGKPIMFVTGTGATGDQGYLIGQDAFEQYGHPVCYVNFPDFTTADIQVVRPQDRGGRYQPGRTLAALRADLLA